MSSTVIEAASLPLLALLEAIEGRLAAGEAALRIVALDPERGRGRYTGEQVEVDGRVFVHRPYRAWVDLAERLGLRMMTPTRLGGGLVEIPLERIDDDPAWARGEAASERYGDESGFSRIHRLEAPGFVADVREALARIELREGARVLALGCGRGDELGLIHALSPGLGPAGRLVGVDHSASALAIARERWPGPTFEFLEADLAALPSLDLGVFDLALAIGVFQSPGVDDRALIRHLVQERLGERGALLLGAPNCRYRGGEVVHGARIRNLREAELGLVIADLAYYRRYLHQHRRRVFVTGRDYLLLTAIAAAPGALPRASP